MADTQVAGPALQRPQFPDRGRDTFVAAVAWYRARREQPQYVSRPKVGGYR